MGLESGCLFVLGGCLFVIVSILISLALVANYYTLFCDAPLNHSTRMYPE